MPGYSCVDHVLPVPLDYANPGGEQIEIFAREVMLPSKEYEQLPWLVYLQGGPGGKADRPTFGHDWLGRALREYRVALLDQRGTGRSTPVNRQTLGRRGSAAAQADYLRRFRADAIVADAERLRRELAGGDQPWSVLGQSYGGFCAVTYLSFHPEGLREVLIAGGLPSLIVTAEEVYRAAYPRVLTKNEVFFSRFPGDEGRARQVALHLRNHDVRLPRGDQLTVRRFQTVGLDLGMARCFDTVHFLLEEAFIEGRAGPELSDTFLRGVDAAVSYDDRPLFAVMHESIYGQGGATRWAAERVRTEFPEFAEDAVPFRFTGEMIYPWLFEESSALAPLRDGAHRLAEIRDWPPLYDTVQLAKNEVPVAPAIYTEDMYVDPEHSRQTARAIHGLRPYMTNQYEHDGLRCGEVLDRLIALARGDS